MELQQINMMPILNELDDLAGQTDSKLFDHGKGQSSSPLTLINLILRQMRFSLQTGLHINSGKEEKDSPWTPEVMLSWSMVNRNLVDVLCNLVFILEEPLSRVPSFKKAGWRDAALNLQRLQTEFGHSPDLQKGLASLDKWVSEYAGELGLSPEEKQDPKTKIQPWIGIGKMADHQISSNADRPPQRELIHFLYQWYYPQYSWTAHGQWYGFLRNGSVLFRSRFVPEQREIIDNEQIALLGSIEPERALLFYLCAVTEIDLYFKFGFAFKLLDLWTRILQLPLASAFEAATIYQKGFENRKVISIAERNGENHYGFFQI